MADLAEPAEVKTKPPGGNKMSDIEQADLIRLAEEEAGIRLPRPRMSKTEIVNRYSFVASNQHGIDIGCQDEAKAKTNRQRVTEGYCNSYYESQTRICQAWKPEDPAPAELRLNGVTHSAGELRWLKNITRMKEVLGLNYNNKYNHF